MDLLSCRGTGEPVALSKEFCCGVTTTIVAVEVGMLSV
jgi:hypothetical protein